jgi:uncharacterized DUF497 family protein
MKYFDWNALKNEQLKQERGIGFEEVIVAINEGRILDTLIHPEQKKYPGQRIYVIQIDEYAYLIPFVEDEEKVFLKTIFPSRKATKKYIIKQ